MAHVALSNENYVDYVASLYLHAVQVDDVKFTLKYAPQTEKNSVPAILVHVEGVQRSTGIIVNFDIWPRNDFADETELLKFFAKAEDGTLTPKFVPDDIHFRVGYRAVKDLETGETKVIESKPKMIALIKDGKKVVLTGEKREYQG